MDNILRDFSFSNLIRLIRELSVIFVLGYLIIMLISGNLGLDFTKLSSSELISILLAFFSISLATAFYFAATKQSSQFYDNVNKFSKDTSELLGRLDEQVKSIGGRQTELKDSIDKYYLGPRSKSNENAQELTEKKEKEVEENLSKIVKEILDKANLSGPERLKYELKLKERDSELKMLRERLGRLSSRNEIPLRRYTRRQIEKMGVSNALDLEPSALLLHIAKKGPLGYKRDLAAMGYIKTEKIKSMEDITEKGSSMIARELEQLIEHDGGS